MVRLVLLADNPQHVDSDGEDDRPVKLAVNKSLKDSEVLSVNGVKTSNEKNSPAAASKNKMTKLNSFDIEETFLPIEDKSAKNSDRFNFSRRDNPNNSTDPMASPTNQIRDQRNQNNGEAKGLIKLLPAGGSTYSPSASIAFQSMPLTPPDVFFLL